MNVRPCFFGSGITFEESRRFDRNFVDRESLPERTTSILLSAVGPISRWSTDYLFDYDIFPSGIMRFESEWRKERRSMKMGDIIVQRAMIPPIGFGVCLEFAVRICSVFKEEARVGFAYETLSGHAESGVSEFYFEERGSDLHFTIHTFSEPGHWSSRFASRLFTLPYQAWCTRQALAHVRKRFHEENKEANQSVQTRPTSRPV